MLHLFIGLSIIPSICVHCAPHLLKIMFVLILCFVLYITDATSTELRFLVIKLHLMNYVQNPNRKCTVWRCEAQHNMYSKLSFTSFSKRADEAEKFKRLQTFTLHIALLLLLPLPLLAGNFHFKCSSLRSSMQIVKFAPKTIAKYLAWK